MACESRGHWLFATRLISGASRVNTNTSPSPSTNTNTNTNANASTNTNANTNTTTNTNTHTNTNENNKQLIIVKPRDRDGIARTILRAQKTTAATKTQGRKLSARAPRAAAIYLSIFLSFFFSFAISIYLSLSLSIYLSIYPPVYPEIFRLLYLSILPSIAHAPRAAAICRRAEPARPLPNPRSQNMLYCDRLYCTILCYTRLD